MKRHQLWHRLPKKEVIQFLTFVNDIENRLLVGGVNRSLPHSLVRRLSDNKTKSVPELPEEGVVKPGYL